MTTAKLTLDLEKADKRFAGAGSMFTARDAERRAQKEHDKLYSSMPSDTYDVPDRQRYAAPGDVVKGLGFKPPDEAIWADRVDRLVGRAKDELHLRKSVQTDLRGIDNLATDVRTELARRILAFFRQKNDVEKAFPPGQPQPKQPQQARAGGGGAGPMATSRGRQPQAPPARPGSMGDPSAGGKPGDANPLIDGEDLENQPQDPALLKQKIHALHEQLKQLAGSISSNAAFIHTFNDLKAEMRNLLREPDPEAVAALDHKIHHFEKMVNGPEPLTPPLGQPGQPGGPGGGPMKPGMPPPGGPQQRPGFKRPGAPPAGGGAPFGKSGFFIAEENLDKAFGGSHKYIERKPKPGGGYDYVYADDKKGGAPKSFSQGPAALDHTKVFAPGHDAVLHHSEITQDRQSPDDAVQRSAGYHDKAMNGGGKKREALEVWKVNHPDGTSKFHLRDGNTTFQMLKQKGMQNFPVKVTKTVDAKDYTPVGPHEAHGDPNAAAPKSATSTAADELKKQEKAKKLKETISKLHEILAPSVVHDEHGQPQGEVQTGKLKGDLDHHIAVAKDFLDKHAKTLDRDMTDLKALAPADAKVKGRVKDLESSIGKLIRKPKYGDVSKLQDGTGMRIVAHSIQEVKDTVNKIKAKYKVVAEDNYIDKPNGHGTDEDFGYRSHHLIIETPDGLQKEIQVRTEGQDKHADYAHDLYKPVNATQEKAMEKHGAAGKDYSKKMGDWLFKKENGEDPGEKPVPHPDIKAAFGSLD